MNGINIQYCDFDNKIVISKKVIVKFIYMMVYLCIYIINYKRINAHFNKKEEKEEEEEKEKDVDTWYIIDDGKSRYKGEWKNGLPHGKGSKEIFEGKYKDDYDNPFDSDGKPCCWSMIEGNFVNGRAEGYGKQFFKDEGEETQPYYEGEFYNGKHDGQGAYYYGNGSYYKGNFKGSRFHGVGYHYYVKLNKTWVGKFDFDRKASKDFWILGKLE